VYARSLPDQAANQGRANQPPIGVIYNTSMDRPDAALALAAVHILSSRGDARLGAICVGGSGLNAAIFCDIVGRFYTPALRSSNTNLPVGLAVTTPPSPDPPMIAPAIDRKKENGDPQYVRSVGRITDTSLAEAMLRNGATINPESVVVLSAPATWLARSLELAGTKDLYAKRVKRLVIVEAGVAGKDPAALGRLVAEWPTPIFLCGREVGESLPFPGANLDQLFAWSPAHPVADAYRAFKPMPYNTPLHDIAAVHYAIHPESGFFTPSESGSVSITSDGGLKFAPGASNVRKLTLNLPTKAEALDALVTIATSKPTPPPGRGRAG